MIPYELNVSFGSLIIWSVSYRKSVAYLVLKLIY